MTGTPLTCLERRPQAALRVVCFPHAGGSPSAFHSWRAALGESVEVWGVTLPGRAARSAEPFALDWQPVVDEIVRAVLDEVTAPFALFGHSMGAAVAFEVAHGLCAEGVPPVHLGVSGRAAPDDPLRLAVPRSDRALIHTVDTVYEGIPDEVRAVPELLEYFLPVLRADLELAARYSHRPRPALAVPVTALAGDRDRTVSAAQLDAWGRHTCASFSAHWFDGGHFYLGRREAQVLRLLRGAWSAPTNTRAQIAGSDADSRPSPIRL